MAYRPPEPLDINNFRESPTNARRIPFEVSNIENIDFAMTQWLKEQNIFCDTTNKDRYKVPVVWTSAERAYQVKNNKELRDSSGALILPIITLERSAVVKGMSAQAKGIFHGNPFPPAWGRRLEIARVINHDKTQNFVNMDMKRSSTYENFPQPHEREKGLIDFVVPKRKKANKTVYKIYSIPFPVHLDITYTINVKSQYQTQMNEIVSPFFTRTGGINYFMIENNGHRYEAFIQEDFSQDNNVTDMGTEERIYQTKFDIKVLGYVNGDDNQEYPQVEVRENAVEVKIGRENIVWDAKIPTNKKDEKREYVERGGSTGAKTTS